MLFSDVPEATVAQRFAAFGGSVRHVLTQLGYTMDSLKQQFWPRHAAADLHKHLLEQRTTLIEHPLVHIYVSACSRQLLYIVMALAHVAVQLYATSNSTVFVSAWQLVMITISPIGASTICMTAVSCRLTQTCSPSAAL